MKKPNSNGNNSSYEDYQDLRGKGMKKEEKRSHKRSSKRYIQDIVDDYIAGSGNFEDDDFYYEDVDNFERW